MGLGRRAIREDINTMPMPKFFGPFIDQVIVHKIIIIKITIIIIIATIIIIIEICSVIRTKM